MNVRGLPAIEGRMMSMIVSQRASKLVLPSYYKNTSERLQEGVLHRDCMQFMKRLGWRLAAHEWQVVTGMEHFGRGDMVFEKGPFYLVMEAKRKRNRKVFDQARFYGAAWKLQRARAGCAVAYGIWTVSSQELLGVVPNKRVAADICWERFSASRL